MHDERDDKKMTPLDTSLLQVSGYERQPYSGGTAVVHLSASVTRGHRRSLFLLLLTVSKDVALDAAFGLSVFVKVLLVSHCGLDRVAVGLWNCTQLTTLDLGVRNHLSLPHTPVSRICISRLLMLVSLVESNESSIGS